MQHLLGSILRQNGVDSWGICRFSDLLPLRVCSAAKRVPQGTRSVLIMLFPYYIGEFPQRNVARYAVVDDYHSIAGTILDVVAHRLRQALPQYQFTSFVDNSPLDEVRAAHLAGLGVIGRHRQLIHRHYGAYVFIGAVVTDMPLSQSKPATGKCLDCGACLRACPTGALGDGGFDQNLCRSHITQKKGVLTDWESAQIRAGGLVWGCDQCLEACPMAIGKMSPLTEFYREPAPFFSPDEMDRLLQRKPYAWRGKAVLLRNYQILYGDLPDKQE